MSERPKARSACEHAERFVAKGARVVLTDLNRELGEQVAAGLGDAAKFVEHDVTDHDSRAVIVAAAHDRCGAVDILINNAGRTGPVAPLLSQSVDDYQATIAVDQHGVLYGMLAVTGNG